MRLELAEQRVGADEASGGSDGHILVWAADVESRDEAV